MSTIIYCPDGKDLTFRDTLQFIADDIRSGKLPEQLFVYGNFYKTSSSLILEIESINLNLSGLEDALGLLVANKIPSIKTTDQLKKLFAAYEKHRSSSPAIQQRLVIRVTQWAQAHMTDLNDVIGLL